jgi:hypothetical protein
MKNGGNWPVASRSDSHNSTLRTAFEQIDFRLQLRDAFQLNVKLAIHVSEPFFNNKEHLALPIVAWTFNAFRPAAACTSNRTTPSL